VDLGLWRGGRRRDTVFAMNHTLERILHWTVIGGVFLLPFVPFIVVTQFFFPFITGKNFAFRAIVEVIAVAWLALALVNPTYRPKRNWMLAAFAGFVLIIGIADLLSPNVFKSFWSNFERMEGWITLAHLFAYFVVATSVLIKENLWHRLAATSIGASVLMGIYALFQLAGFIVINQGGARVDATFGNATYLAVYMLFHIFLTALVLAKWRMPEGMRLYIRIGLGAVIALQTFVLIMTATRGAVLGLIGGVILTTLLLMWFGRGSSVVRKASAGVFVALVLIAGGFFLIKDTRFVQESNVFNRFANMSLEDKTVQARFMVWNMAWQGFAESPKTMLIGWGQESFNFVFNKYYNPNMFDQEPWFDRVHNIFFDWLIAGGILGLLGYLSLWLVSFYYLWLARGSDDQPVFSVAEKSIFTGLGAAYFFHNIFVFDNIVSYLLFVSLLAYLAVRAANAKGARALLPDTSLPHRSISALLVVAVVLAGGLLWGVNGKAIAANRAVLKGLSPPPDGNIMQNLARFEEAISYNTVGVQEAREHLSQLTANLAQNPTMPDEMKQQYYDSTVRELEAHIARVPGDARFPLFLGAVHSVFGQFEAARISFERAHELSPAKQDILFKVGANAFARGEHEEAFDAFREAYELEPRYEDAHVLYTAAAIRAEKDELVGDLLAQLKERGLETNPQILNAYVERGRYDRVIEIWRAHIAENPENVQAYFSLSAAYYEIGRRDLSIATLEEVKQVNEAIVPQANQFIEQIRQGTAQLE